MSRDLINAILENKAADASSILKETMAKIATAKLVEAKKIVAAKFGLSEIVEAMSDAARKLTLHADNDAQLHKSSHMPIVANLKKKVAKGTYDHEKAKKLWLHHANRAADSYAKEYGQKGHQMFSMSDRKQAADHFADSHKDQVHEETESLEEISKDTAVRYINRAASDKTSIEGKPFKADSDAPRIKKRMKGIRMASKRILAKEETLDEAVESLDEANVQRMGRLSLVKARIRGGKIQRRKKVSAVKGYTLRGGRLTRMSAQEKLRRKRGARRGKIKRRAKASRIRMRFQRSLRRRKAMGLK